MLKDILLIIAVVVFVGILFYFSVWKYRKDPCHGCPYAKGCTKTCDKKNKHK